MFSPAHILSFICVNFGGAGSGVVFARVGAVVGLCLSLGACSVRWAVSGAEGTLCLCVCWLGTCASVLLGLGQKAAPLVSRRTLMGPYGMDRTVHCFDFYDCANGLGEYWGQQSGLGHLKRPLSPQSLCQDVPLCEVWCLTGSCVLYLPVSSIFCAFCSCDIKRMSKSQLIPW